MFHFLTHFRVNRNFCVRPVDHRILIIKRSCIKRIVLLNQIDESLRSSRVHSVAVEFDPQAVSIGVQAMSRIDIQAIVSIRKSCRTSRDLSARPRI